ncbi:MAG: hypothetical protein AB7O78_09920 [Thermoleophilia bacterium]
MSELTPGEAAEILGVARSTVRLKAESGRRPCRSPQVGIVGSTSTSSASGPRFAEAH